MLPIDDSTGVRPLSGKSGCGVKLGNSWVGRERRRVFLLGRTLQLRGGRLVGRGLDGLTVHEGIEQRTGVGMVGEES